MTALIGVTFMLTHLFLFWQKPFDIFETVLSELNEDVLETNTQTDFRCWRRWTVPRDGWELRPR